MLRKTMIVLATAVTLTGGLTADAFARGGGGGGGHGGGGGGGHMGGGFGGGHIGGGPMGGRFGGFGHGFAGQHFAGTRGHRDHSRRFDHDRRFRFGFVPGDYGYYDYGCSYGYPYYNPYSCYQPTY
jgi:hypothetical protein